MSSRRLQPFAPRRVALSASSFACALVALALGPALVGAAASEAGRLAASAATTSAALALCAVGGAALAREPMSARLGLATRPLDARFGARRSALAVIGFLALSQSLDTLVALLGLRERGVLAHFDEAIVGARPGDLALLVLAVGIGPGVAEELFSRGWLQRGFARRMRPAAAIAFASAIFGALHVDPVHATSAFILGLGLGWLAWRSDGIRVPVACHVANNLAALATSRLGWSGAGAATPRLVSLLVLGIGVVAVLATLRGLPRGERAL